MTESRPSHLDPRLKYEIRVRLNECDRRKNVLTAEYLNYVDIAFTELCRAALGSYSRLTEGGVEPVVSDAKLSLVSPARFDDILCLEGGIEHLGRSTSVFRLRMSRGGDTLVDATLRYVFVDAGTWKSTEIPAWAREGLERFRVSNSGS